MFGCIVTTSSLAVGARCPHAAAGIGAVLTQHMTDPRLGPLGLEMLRLGYTAPQVLAGLTALTPRADWRQLGVIDASGTTATFTGASNRPEQGDVHGTDCFALANIVRSAEVPIAMVRAFEASPDDHIARRLLDALAAGHAAGSEFNPLVSTALLVVDRHSFPHVDLRVDGDPDPIGALERLWAEYAPQSALYDLRATDPDEVIRTHHPQPAGPT